MGRSGLEEDEEKEEEEVQFGAKVARREAKVASSGRLCGSHSLSGELRRRAL